MKYSQCFFSILVVFVTTCETYTQATHNRNYALKIKTEEGVYKGRLTNVADSTIEIMSKRNGTTMVVTANRINQIIIKKPFLSNTLEAGAAGGILADVIVLLYYGNQYVEYGRPDPSDPTLGRALWMSTAFGVGIGLLSGSIESLFIHKKMRINRAAYVFENKRGKLKKYLYY